jgi:SAM-dependent methyltransferase
MKNKEGCTIMPYAMGEYYDRVDDYDLQYQEQSEQDVPFWRELVTRYTPQHVLELACGSGRIGLELLHMPATFVMEGLDIDNDMLLAYQKRLEREPERVQQRVTLHQLDMSDYNLASKGRFDLIFLPFNSICHLYEVKQQLDMFRTTYDHLMPGGRFVVDVFVPDIDYLSNALNRPSTVYLEDEIEDPDGEFTMLIYSTRKYDLFEQNQRLTWTHERFMSNGENERYFSRLDMHQFFPRELQLLFLSTGFQVETIYGDYNWKPFGQGTRQIVVGRKVLSA